MAYLRSSRPNARQIARFNLAYRKLGAKTDAEREYAAFQEIRKVQESIRPLYQELEQRPATTQPDEPAKPQ
jgi:hypothetical protein